MQIEVSNYLRPGGEGGSGGGGPIKCEIASEKTSMGYLKSLPETLLQHESFLSTTCYMAEPNIFIFKS